MNNYCSVGQQYYFFWKIYALDEKDSDFSSLQEDGEAAIYCALFFQFCVILDILQPVFRIQLQIRIHADRIDLASWIRIRKVLTRSV